MRTTLTIQDDVAKLIQRMRAADIVITNKAVMDKPAIDAAPSLKLICVAATGMNNVDLEYAGTDVVSTEPIASDSPLLKITHQERLSITPHIAWSSTESRRRLIAGIKTNIERFLSDRPGGVIDNRVFFWLRNRYNLSDRFSRFNDRYTCFVGLANPLS